MPQTSGSVYRVQTPLDLSKIVANESWTNLTNIAKSNQWYLELPLTNIFNGFPNIQNVFLNVTQFTCPGFSSQNVNKMYRGMPIPVPGGVRKEGNDNLVKIEYSVDSEFITYKLFRLWFYLNEFAMKRETINTVSLETFDQNAIAAYCGLVPAIDISLYYVNDKKQIAFITQFLNCFPDTFGETIFNSDNPTNLKHTVDLKFFMHRDLM